MLGDQALQRIADPAACEVIGLLVGALNKRDATIPALHNSILGLEAKNAQLCGEDLRNALEASPVYPIGNTRLRDVMPPAQGKQSKPWARRKGSKVAGLPIDRTLGCRLAPEALPADARLERQLKRTPTTLPATT